ncbi:hypothetical protein SO694_00107098 [Aureococcus anophagefferens]|uniref:Uncharacterized protein n=1 Tax=Aureococcus anophagefferens TaxID=44056 RepID=A0ABR1FMK6_AURAN
MKVESSVTVSYAAKTKSLASSYWGHSAVTLEVEDESSGSEDTYQGDANSYTFGLDSTGVAADGGSSSPNRAAQRASAAITYRSAEVGGDVALLGTDATQLSGTGASVSVSVEEEGAQIYGSFQLRFNGYTTGAVTVSRSGPLTTGPDLAPNAYLYRACPPWAPATRRQPESNHGLVFNYTSKGRVGRDGFMDGGCNPFETEYQNVTAFTAQNGLVNKNNCTYSGCLDGVIQRATSRSSSGLQEATHYELQTSSSFEGTGVTTYTIDTDRIPSALVDDYESPAFSGPTWDGGDEIMSYLVEYATDAAIPSTESVTVSDGPPPTKGPSTTPSTASASAVAVCSVAEGLAVDVRVALRAPTFPRLQIIRAGGG